MIERLRSILRDGKSAGVFAVADVKLAAFAIASACEYAFQWYRPEGPLSVDEVADKNARMMEHSRGVAPRRHSCRPAR